ncbi:MAG: gamma-glutamyltransferase [Halieaceae bacterium]|nr:gamma-glutamyltransferase [Halieaceae bacterium]
MSIRHLRSLLIPVLMMGLTTIVSAQPASDAQPPIINYDNRFLPIAAKDGMVVGPERLASEVGRDILAQGGNAVDAAVATGFALAVTYPRAGNLAGGGFMLIHLADENRQTLIDYRETAPATASRDLFLNEDGEVDRMREYFSHQSAGTPGSVAGLIYAQEKYGTLPLKKVLQPAIALAKNGFPVSFALNFEFNARAERLKQNEEAKRLFFTPAGETYAIGDNFVQSDLAWTLGQIAERGHDGFYKGEVAEKIVAEMEAGDGLISLEDLASYKVVERTPVTGTFRDYTVVSTPPPSSGGLHIIQILNLLEPYALKDMGHNSAAYLHVLTESMKRAYADRSRFLGDPDYVDVPVAALTDKGYADRLREGINEERATPAKDIVPGASLPEESSDTTHYTVADAAGNVVSNTYTLNFSFGSHIAVPGTGMLLNNEMADFAASPGNANAYGLVQGEANSIMGGKRPLSSMSPTMVFKDGKVWLATGSPGGSLIITTVLQTILNAMVFDVNIATAAAWPRVHHQWLPDKLRIEQGVSKDTVRLLESMGHTVEVGSRTLGRTQSIMLEDGWLFGATDTRRHGGYVAGDR